MKTILLIEDDVDIIEDLTRLLNIQGYHVIAATDGYGGLKLIEEATPDLVLCDIQLPDIDGFAIVESVREVAPDLPFIFLSARTRETDIRRGYALGASGYLKKPVSVFDLFSTLQQFVDI